MYIPEQNVECQAPAFLLAWHDGISDWCCLEDGRVALGVLLLRMVKGVKYGVWHPGLLRWWKVVLGQRLLRGKRRICRSNVCGRKNRDRCQVADELQLSIQPFASLFLSAINARIIRTGLRQEDSIRPFG